MKLCHHRHAMSVEIDRIHNCRNELYHKSATNRSNGVRGLQCWPTCSKQPRLVDCRIGVVNKLDRRRRRRVLFTARSTCRDEIFEVRSLGQISRGNYPSFRRYPNFLITQCGIGRRKPSCQKPSSIRPVVLIQYQLATDRRTDTRLQQIQRASIAPFWKQLNHHISATVWLILLKFGTVTHIGPLQRIDH